jgi:N-acetylated-alpha-linked acidic dipeptidase
MRMADSDVLPFDFTDQADTYRTYLKELQNLLKSKQDETKERNRELDEGVFNAISDPEEPTMPPPRLDTPPAINFAPLENGVEALNEAAQHYDSALKKAEDAGASPATLHDLNEKLFKTERLLLSEKGLPNRPWFRHQIYAPGAYTGYAVKTMPMVRESLEQRQWSTAEEGSQRIGGILRQEATAVNDAAAELEKNAAGK